MTTLALDVGGANLKAAHASGATRSRAFALWRHPDRLADALRRLAEEMPGSDRVVATMTGELCDCFATKADGVQEILDALSDVCIERKLSVWTVDGRFLDLSSARCRPEMAAAANWLALATVAARLVPVGLLIDVGSTTSDIIPLRGGLPIPRGRTDTGRLRSGELVYAGIKRTPICALASVLPHRGEPTGLIAELFATTRDVYLTLGDLAEEPDDLDTADGRAATRERARDRLARMVGADRDEFSAEDAHALARSADEALMDRLVTSARRVAAESLGGPPDAIVISGSGESLARRVAERILAPGGSVVSLAERWGPGASDCACAYALMLLASGGEP